MQGCEREEYQGVATARRGSGTGEMMLGEGRIESRERGEVNVERSRAGPKTTENG